MGARQRPHLAAAAAAAAAARSIDVTMDDLEDELGVDLDAMLGIAPDEPEPAPAPGVRVDPRRHKVVCKHWLRGLCKKGDDCDFLHQLDRDRMPECWFFSNFGECSNKDCIFLHLRPEDKVRTRLVAPSSAGSRAVRTCRRRVASALVRSPSGHAWALPGALTHATPYLTSPHPTSPHRRSTSALGLGEASASTGRAAETGTRARSRAPSTSLDSARKGRSVSSATRSTHSMRKRPHPHWRCPGSARAVMRRRRLLRARLAALGSSTHPGREAGPLGAQPPPRVLELAASNAADSAEFDLALALALALTLTRYELPVMMGGEQGQPGQHQMAGQVPMAPRLPRAMGQGFGGGGGGMGGGGMGGGVGGSSYRDVKAVTCFRCWQQGHYANHCPNAKVPAPAGHPEAQNRNVY